jgi:hypothetical protein
VRVALDHSLQVPLPGPDGRVRSPQRTAHGPGLIPLERPRAGARGRHCGRERRDLHGLEAVVRRRHRPWGDVPGCGALRPTRWRGPSGVGHPPPTPRCAWDEPRSPNPQASAPGAWRLGSHAPGTDAARTRGRSEETLDGRLDRWRERDVDGSAGAWWGVIGRDASARPRGPRAGVTRVTAPLEGGGGAIRAGLADRPQATVAAWRGAIPAHLRRTSARACAERAEGVVRARAAAVPWAARVIDRGPGARAYRDGAATVRTTAVTPLQRARPTAEDAERHGARGPFRTRPAALTLQAGVRLQRVVTDAPTREAADHRRADRTDLCAREETTVGAT